MSMDRLRTIYTTRDGAEEKICPLESGDNVRLNYRIFNPEPSEDARERAATHENIPTDKAVVFLPGWSMGAGAESVETLCKKFAQRSESRTYSITTRTEKMGAKDRLYEEAKVIAQFIRDKGIKEVTLAGHSQGGDKAINVASILQEDPTMQVELVLLDSVGLYPQSRIGLAARFLKNSILTIMGTVLADKTKDPEASKKVSRVTKDIALGIIREMSESGLGYPRRFLNDVRDMAMVNPRLKELKIPIVLMSGADDPVSDPEKIFLEAKSQPEHIRTPQSLSTPKKFVDPREEDLKRLFPNSPYIRMITPTKHGSHDMPVYRDSVGAVALYLLERYRRSQRQQQSLPLQPSLDNILSFRAKRPMTIEEYQTMRDSRQAIRTVVAEESLRDKIKSTRQSAAVQDMAADVHELKIRYGG
jgi:pimeloyl-ACP methyl ester carboxylesterase